MYFGDEVGVVDRWLHPGANHPDLSADKVDQIKAAVGTAPRWREYPTAEMWVGKAVAPVLGLDPVDDAVELKVRLRQLIRTGVLKVIYGTDARESLIRLFVVYVAPGFQAT